MKNQMLSKAVRFARGRYRESLRFNAARAAAANAQARAIYAQTLKEIAIEKFNQLHPPENWPENWPEWMRRRAEFKVKFPESANCKVSIIVKVDGPMPENFFWYDKETRTLARRSEDGEIGIVIHFSGSPEIITVFEAEVDPETLQIKILVDNDPATMIFPPPEFFYDGW